MVTITGHSWTESGAGTLDRLPLMREFEQVTRSTIGLTQKMKETSKGNQ